MPFLLPNQQRKSTKDIAYEYDYCDVMFLSLFCGMLKLYFCMQICKLLLLYLQVLVKTFL